MKISIVVVAVCFFVSACNQTKTLMNWDYIYDNPEESDFHPKNILIYKIATDFPGDKFRDSPYEQSLAKYLTICGIEAESIIKPSSKIFFDSNGAPSIEDLAGFSSARPYDAVIVMGWGTGDEKAGAYLISVIKSEKMKLMSTIRFNIYDMKNKFVPQLLATHIFDDLQIKKIIGNCNAR